MLPGAAAPPEADALLDGLTPAICALWDSALRLLPDVAATSVVVAGERGAVRALLPQHEGRAPHAAALVPRALVLRRLRAMGHADVGAELDLPHDPDRIDVLLAVAGGLLVAELRRPEGVGRPAPARPAARPEDLPS